MTVGISDVQKHLLGYVYDSHMYTLDLHDVMPSILHFNYSTGQLQVPLSLDD